MNKETRKGIMMLMDIKKEKPKGIINLKEVRYESEKASIELEKTGIKVSSYYAIKDYDLVTYVYSIIDNINVSSTKIGSSLEHEKWLWTKIQDIKRELIWVESWLKTGEITTINKEGEELKEEELKEREEEILTKTELKMTEHKKYILENMVDGRGINTDNIEYQIDMSNYDKKFNLKYILGNEIGDDIMWGSKMSHILVELQEKILKKEKEITFTEKNVESKSEREEGKYVIDGYEITDIERKVDNRLGEIILIVNIRLIALLQEVWKMKMNFKKWVSKTKTEEENKKLQQKFFIMLTNKLRWEFGSINKDINKGTLIGFKEKAWEIIPELIEYYESRYLEFLNSKSWKVSYWFDALMSEQDYLHIRELEEWKKEAPKVGIGEPSIGTIIGEKEISKINKINKIKKEEDKEEIKEEEKIEIKEEEETEEEKEKRKEKEVKEAFERIWIKWKEDCKETEINVNNEIKDWEINKEWNDSVHWYKEAERLYNKREEKNKKHKKWNDARLTREVLNYNKRLGKIENISKERIEIKGKYNGSLERQRSGYKRYDEEKWKEEFFTEEEKDLLRPSIRTRLKNNKGLLSRKLEKLIIRVEKETVHLRRNEKWIEMKPEIQKDWLFIDPIIKEYKEVRMKNEKARYIKKEKREDQLGYDKSINHGYDKIMLLKEEREYVYDGRKKWNWLKFQGIMVRRKTNMGGHDQKRGMVRVKKVVESLSTGLDITNRTIIRREGENNKWKIKGKKWEKIESEKDYFKRESEAYIRSKSVEWINKKRVGENVYENEEYLKGLFKFLSKFETVEQRVGRNANFKPYLWIRRELTEGTKKSLFIRHSKEWYEVRDSDWLQYSNFNGKIIKEINYKTDEIDKMSDWFKSYIINLNKFLKEWK